MELRSIRDTSGESLPEERLARPSRILTASVREKIGVVVGLPVSFYAVCSLTVFHPGHLPTHNYIVSFLAFMSNAIDNAMARQSQVL
jgi:hypothetical protein